MMSDDQRRAHNDRIDETVKERKRWGAKRNKPKKIDHNVRPPEADRSTSGGRAIIGAGDWAKQRVKDDELVDLAAAAAAEQSKLAGQLRALLAKVRDAQEAQPGAQSLNPTGGGRVVFWCDDHDRELKVCRKMCSVHDVLLINCRRVGSEAPCIARTCDGVPIDVDDATGEAAIVDDSARDDETEIFTITERIARDVELLRRIREAYFPKQPTERDRHDQARSGEPECALCALVGHYAPPCTKGPSGIRDSVTGLDRVEQRFRCWSHYKFAQATGRDADRSETRNIIAGKPNFAVIDGQRVRIPA